MPQVKLGDIEEVQEGRQMDLRMEDHEHGTKFSVKTVDGVGKTEGGWDQIKLTTVEFGEITSMAKRIRRDLANLEDARKAGKPNAQFSAENPCVVYLKKFTIPGKKEDGSQKYGAELVDNPPGPIGSN